MFDLEESINLTDKYIHECKFALLACHECSLVYYMRKLDMSSLVREIHLYSLMVAFATINHSNVGAKSLFSQEQLNSSSMT